jgi:SAM-dependent methyltransferase
MDQPLPDYLQVEASFADAHYAPWSNCLEMNLELFRRYAQPRFMWDWRQRLGSYLGDLRGLAVVDLGCGQGEEAVYLAKLGAHVTAIDIATTGIEIARRRASHNGVADRVNLVVGRVDPTPFPDRSFDVIHGIGIMHHVGVEPSVEEIRRLLKPGGRAVFFEHMGNCPAFERQLRRVLPGDYTQHERPVTWAELRLHADRFAEMRLHSYHVLCRLRPLRQTTSIRVLDHVALTLCPPLRFFASGVVIYLRMKA